MLGHLNGIISSNILRLLSCHSIASQYVPEGTLCGRWWILVDVDAVDDGLVVPLLASVASSVASSVAITVAILSVLVAATALLLLLAATLLLLLLLATAFLLLLLL